MIRFAPLAAAVVSLAWITPLSAIEPERDFSGKWMLDARGGDRRALPVPPDEMLTVAQQDVAVRCEARSPDGSTVRWSYLLDGTETRSRIGDETRNSVVKWEGAALLVNTLVSGPGNYTVMDRWKLSPDRAVLTITRQVVMRSGETEDVLVYKREERLSTREVSAAPPAPVAETVPPPPPIRPRILMRPPEPPAPGDLTVVAGTRIALALRNSVDTKHSHEGDHIYLETIAPVAAEGRIAIPQGSFVTGTVTQSKAAHGIKGKGELFIRFDSLTLPNGTTRDFRSHLASADSARGQVDSKEGKVTGERDGSEDARTVAMGTGVGAGVGGLAGAASGHPWGGVGIGAAAGAAIGLASVLHGKRPEAVLPRGTLVEMILDRDLRFSPADLRF
jgi:type IV secretion system protein VirB10